MEKARYNADDFDIVEDAVSAEEFKKIRKAATNILYTHQSKFFFKLSIPFCFVGVFMAQFTPENMFPKMFSSFEGFMNSIGDFFITVMIFWFIISPLVIGWWAITSRLKHDESQRFLNKHVAERANQIRIQNRVVYERKLEEERQRQRAMSDGMLGSN